MNHATPSPNLGCYLPRIANTCALFVAALGLAAMAGWLFGVGPFQTALSSVEMMQFNTARGFLITGGALFFRDNPAARLGLATAVGLLGAFSLGPSLSVLDPGLALLFVREGVELGVPEPMSPVTALCFLLGSVALGLRGTQVMERWAEALAASVGTIGFVSLLSYAFGTQNSHNIPGFALGTLYTAAGFVVFSAGVLCTLPRGIVVLLLYSRGTGRSLWLGFGALTALLLIIGIVAMVQLRKIGMDVNAQADIDRRRAALAREMEINVLDYGLEMQTFLVGDLNAHARAKTSAQIVGRCLAQYEQLAEIPRHHELAARFTTLWHTFRTEGDALMASGHENRVALLHIVSLRHVLKKFLHDEMQLEAVATYNASRAATVGIIEKTERLMQLLLIVGVVIAMVTSGGGMRVLAGGEEALRQSEERFRLLVEQTPDGILVVDRAGRYTDVNPAGAEMLGYTREEFLRLEISDLITPSECPRLAVNFVNNTDGPSTRVECRFRRKDRSELHGELVVRRFSGGGYFSILRDIAERDREEEVVSLNASLFARIIEQAPGGVYVMDAHLRVREVNTEALPVFATVQPVIGRRVDEVLETLWGPELGGECTTKLRRTLETGERYVSPRFEHLRHDIGVEQTYEWETQRITLPDGQHGVVCYFKDVTERERAAAALRLSEERLRLAQDAAHIGSFDWNIRTGVNVWTPELEAIYGLPPGGFTQTLEGWERLVHPEDLAEAVRLFERAFATGEPMEGEWRVVWPDGSVHWLLGRFQVFKDADGQLLRMTGVNLDITERKQAEEEVIQLNRKLEQRVAERVADLATKARLLAERNAEVELARAGLEEKAAELERASGYKSEFLSNMSHELRTPLNVILLLSQQLAENKPGNLSSRQIEFAKLVYSSGTDLLNLINDILDLAKIESGTVTVKVEEVSIARMCDSIIHQLQPMADTKKLTLEMSLSGELPVSLLSDTQRVRQILKNLVVNAIKFTSRGRVDLRVAFATQGWHPDHPVLRSAQQVIAFAVKDTGIGIEPEKQRRIFESFHQADAATSRTHGGTGLGLSISRELAALLGGAISLTSTLGQGSTFTLYLPLTFTDPGRTGMTLDREIAIENLPRPKSLMDKPDFARQRVTIGLPVAPSVEGSQPGVCREILRGRKVLLVDDDVRNLFALTALLEAHEMETLSATNGRSAIHLLQTTPDISLVLIDIMMPEMDGYETMRELRLSPQFRTLPVLALTAHAMNGDREKCLHAGASDYITKPVKSQQLLESLCAWMTR